MYCEIAGQRAHVLLDPNQGIKPSQHSVVFIHGAAMDRSVWTLPLRHFRRRGYNAVAVDLPGHGRSAGPPLPSIEAMAQWLIAVLNSLKIESANLVGHSMGSLVAFETARHAPQRVAALAMLGTAIPMAVSDVLLEAAAADDHAAFDMINLWSHARHLGGNRNPGMWMLGGSIRLLERSRPGVLHAALQACTNYLRTESSASAVQCPCTLIIGERDAMTPPRGTQQICERVPHARKIQIAGAGHSMLSEAPNQVLNALIEAIITVHA